MRKLFFSYSHKDKDLRDKLEVQLSILKREGLIEAWHDRKIPAGDELDKAIDEKLEHADVILLLISPDFLASRYCYDIEVKRAMQRHAEGSARVIPVILRACEWQNAPFGKLVAVPTDGKAVTKWRDRDQAFLDVAQKIRGACAVDIRHAQKPTSDKGSGESGFGNSGTSGYRTLAERLAGIGVVPADSLRDPVLLKRLRYPLVVDGMVLRGSLGGFRGIPPNKLRSRNTMESRPLPDYVLKKRKDIPKPEENRTKAFLANWTGPVPDQGGFLDITLGITDFWTNLAVDNSIDLIRRDLREGVIDFWTWPGEAYCDIILITDDGQLLLCQRAGHLYHEPFKWSASIEESVDAGEDLDSSGVLDPNFTTRRAIVEELGLPYERVRTADIKYVAIATDWKNLASAFVIVVHLDRVSASEVRDYWRAQACHEVLQCDPIPLSIENGLKLLTEGPVSLATSANRDAAFHRTAKMRILICLFHEFGYEAVLSALP